MYMINYETVILASWVLFLLVWGIGAFNVKRDVQGGRFVSWSRTVLLRVTGAVLAFFIALRVATGTAHFASQNLWFSRGLFAPSLALGWIGAILTALGVLFAIWARFHLGRNWSPSPAMKEHHELVTSGPYHFVRHPIYTGVLLATFGVALTGNTFGLIIFPIALLIFAFRINREEKIMLKLFPDAYPRYQSRTKRLIPFIW